MRIPRYWSLLLGCLLLALAASAQSRSNGESVGRIPIIKGKDLRDKNAAVTGQGFDIPGIELLSEHKTRHWIGDDTAFSGRTFIDTSWSKLIRSQDSVLAGASVHWVRYHFQAGDDLKGVPLLLNVQCRAGLTLYLNGRLLLQAESMPDHSGPSLPLSDSVPRLSVPVTLLCDGEPEVLALRVEGQQGSSLRSSALAVSLHSADIAYHVQRAMLHYGIFIGINLIILLLALVMGWSGSKDRKWLLLALLSFVSVLDTVCDLGGDMGTLGLDSDTARAMDLFSMVLTPWPPYLLICVLAMLTGGLSPMRARLYTVGVLLMTLIGASTAVADLLNILTIRDGLTIREFTPAILVTMILFGLTFSIIIIWFTIEVVHRGISLVRSIGFERWIGAGALGSSLLTLVLYLISELAGVQLSNWLVLLGDYCSYVALPLSVAVYLATRSAHHNRLVERQRDDLDQEVKERTAELSAERDRSDALLLNILPAEVAEELKRTGEAAARHFDQASVLFTDFKGFTSMTEQVSAGELLQELNTCFKAFDDIIGARGMEKIKTIGDAYMAAGGLPDPHQASATDVVYAALEMQDYMQQRKAERDALGLPAFEMRAGIHTGPVVAGIVGVKKFQYDI